MLQAGKQELSVLENKKMFLPSFSSSVTDFLFHPGTLTSNSKNGEGVLSVLRAQQK